MSAPLGNGEILEFNIRVSPSALAHPRLPVNPRTNRDVKPSEKERIATEGEDKEIDFDKDIVVSDTMRPHVPNPSENVCEVHQCYLHAEESNVHTSIPRYAAKKEQETVGIWNNILARKASLSLRLTNHPKADPSP